MAISETVVADTSPFIHLDQAGHLDLLPRLFGRICVPEIVIDEVLAGREAGIPAPDLRALPWVEVHPNPRDAEVAAWPHLHPGEVAAVGLVRHLQARLLIIDDLAGRSAATSLGIRFIGTAGTVIRARRAGLIPAAAPVFDALAITFGSSPSSFRRHSMSTNSSSASTSQAGGHRPGSRGPTTATAR